MGIIGRLRRVVRIVCVTIFVFSFLPAAAWAEGMSMSLSLDRLSSSHNKTSATLTDSSGARADLAVAGKRAAAGRVEAMYRFDLDPDFTLGVGIGLSLNNVDVFKTEGTVSQSGSTRVVNDGRIRLRSAGRFTFLQPEFRITDQTWALLRLGHADFKSEGRLHTDAAGVAGQLRIDGRLKGLLWGLGVRTRLLEELDGFLMVEQMYLSQAGDSDEKISVLMGRAGLEYRF